MVKLPDIGQNTRDIEKYMDCFPGSHIFCSIPPDKYEGAVVTAKPHHYHTNLSKALPLMEERQKFNWGSFFTINEFTGSRRLISDIKRMRAIFADDDKQKASIRTDFPLPPSIIVESSPGKFHYYWLTDTKDSDTWERVQDGIVKIYDTDPGAKDLARVLRLPDTMNHKYTPPVECKLIECNGKRYDWSEIVKAFPPVPVQENESVPVEGGTKFSLSRSMADFMTAKSISPAMNSLIAHWAFRYSRSKLRELCDDLFKEIPPGVYSDNAQRYEYARGQIDKFIYSAKKTAQKVVGKDKPVIQPATVNPGLPDSLEWDWSLLKSNPIPEDSLPSKLLDAAREIGDWTATGQDPAILSAIFITSSLLSKNIVIHEIGDDLTTHCQSGIVIVMDTGARKSSIYEHMNKPFFEYEEVLSKAWEENKNTNTFMVKGMENQIKTLQKKMEKGGDAEMMAIARQMGEVQNRIDSIQVKKPWLRSADVTEEKLVRKLDDNQGTIAVISDDARQAINNLKGKYNDKVTGESVYINGLTGSDILYERVGSDKEIHIKDPVINALLFVQPDAALGLKNSDMYVPSGLAARLPMYFYPVDGADIVRNTERRSVNRNKLEPYYQSLRNLCTRRFDNPLHIRLSDNGMDACRRIDKKLANLLGGAWSGHYDKINKIVTLTIMYATIFASHDDPAFVSAYRNNDVPDSTYILPTKYLNMAFKFSESLFSQAITSHELITYESMPRKAERFVATLQRFYSEGKIYEGFVTGGDFRNCISTPLREHIGDIMDLLVKKKWVYTTIMTQDMVEDIVGEGGGKSRKLNGGFPNKLVNVGDKIFHLNIEGITKRARMGLDAIESGIVEGKK